MVPLPSNVAVHHIGTWLFAAFHQWWEEGGLVNVEQQEDKHSIHYYLEEQAKEVGPPKPPSFLPCVIVERGAILAVRQPVFALPFFPIANMERHKKRRAGDKDQLESPESGVGDGEVVVVADVVTTGLTGVAVKVLLLVAPDLLTGHQEDQKPENENDGKPDATERRGVLVHSTQEALEEGPVHGAVSEDVRLDSANKKTKKQKNISTKHPKDVAHNLLSA